MDIKSAVLQGAELSRDIHIRPPPEVESKGKVWKLNKCVHGLADAPLYWYNKVKATMLKTAATMSQVDPAVFYWLDKQGSVNGILACHVDDFIWGGSHMFATTVIPHIKSAFQVGREEHDHFRYVGMDFTTAEGGVEMQQDVHIKNLQPVLLDSSRALERDSPLTDCETS